MDVISHPAATASDIRLAHRRDAGQLKQIAELAYAKYVPRMHKPPAPFFYDYAAIADEGMTHVLERDGKVVRIDPSGPLIVQVGAATDLAVDAAIDPTKPYAIAVSAASSIR